MIKQKVTAKWRELFKLREDFSGTTKAFCKFNALTKELTLSAQLPTDNIVAIIRGFLAYRCSLTYLRYIYAQNLLISGNSSMV